MPTAVVPHTSCRVRLEIIQRPFRFRWADCDNGVNVIRAHVQGLQTPTSELAYFANRVLYRATLLSSKEHRFALQLALVIAPPLLLRRNSRCPVVVMKTINRGSLVSVEPRSVAAKRNEIS